MKAKLSPAIMDGVLCKVIGGMHTGKSGTVSDVKTSKTGHITITVVQKNGARFKTLARNVVIEMTALE
jgi:ribosomal protein S4E